MRFRTTVVNGFVAFFACYVFGLASSVLGDDTRPAQILKNYGLERQRGSPSSWSLAVEADVLRNYRSAKALAGQLAAAQEAQQVPALDGPSPRTQIDFFQGQIDIGEARITEIDQQLASLGASVGNATADNWHNLLVQERNAIGREQRRLGTMINNLARQGRGLEQQRLEFNGELGRLREAFQKSVDELRKSIEKIQRNYTELDNQTEVTNALADLSVSTRLKQKLGPSKELQLVIKWLQKSRSLRSERAREAPRRRRR